MRFTSLRDMREKQVRCHYAITAPLHHAAFLYATQPSRPGGECAGSIARDSQESYDIMMPE